MLTHTPAGLDEIIDLFGSLDTPHFESRYIEPFTLPYPLFYGTAKVTRARGHYLAIANFQHVLEGVRDAGLASQVQHYGGIYAARPIRGQIAHPSTHSWGIAIDLEPQHYPLGSQARFSAEVVALFKEAGFCYGGEFLSRKDPMHFQLATNY